MTRDLLQAVRSGCAAVAKEAVSVRIDAEALRALAAGLDPQRLALPQQDPACHLLGEGESTVAFFIVLSAINFGSGFFPAIFGSRPSGYAAVAAALARHFREHGTPAPARLARLTPEECADLCGLDPQHPAAIELLGLYSRALNDLGRLIELEYRGAYGALPEAAGGSAARLVALLVRMPLYNDVACWRGRRVPFYKRAQLLAADLHIAFAGRGPGHFTDIDRLTAFADNLLPHVLRHEGVLRYEAELAARIGRGELLVAGSDEEVELRACAVQAVELLTAELRWRGVATSALGLDNFLWHRGQEPFFRSRPRHRTLTSFY